MKDLYILLFTSLSISLGCVNSKSKDVNKELDYSSMSNSRASKISEKPISLVSPPKNVDVTFEIFLNFFNRDSLFQISRIVFPLKYKEVNWDSENLDLIEKKMGKSEFLKMNFTYDKANANREVDAYEQKIKVDKNKATIEIRGIENGIIADYYFEKINSKWMLLSFEDRST